MPFKKSKIRDSWFSHMKIERPAETARRLGDIDRRHSKGQFTDADYYYMMRLIQQLWRGQQ